MRRILILACALPWLWDIAAWGTELELRNCGPEFNRVCVVDDQGTSVYWMIDGKFYSNEILARQQRYNLWLEHRLCCSAGRTRRLDPEDTLSVGPDRWRSGRPEHPPGRIRETGRLDADTIAIPHYRASLRLGSELRSASDDCRRHPTDPIEQRECSALFSRLEQGSFSRTPADRRQFSEALLSRVEALATARQKAAAYGRAVYDVIQGARETNRQIGLFDPVRDGVNPDQVPRDAMKRMEAADLELALALQEVQWTADVHRQSLGKN